MNTKKLAQYLKRVKKQEDGHLFTANVGETQLISDGKALFSITPSTDLPEYWTNDEIQRYWNGERGEWGEQEFPRPPLEQSFKDWSRLETLSTLTRTNWLYESTHYNKPSDIARRLIYTDEGGKVESLYVDTLYLNLFDVEKEDYELERVKLYETSKVSVVRVVHMRSHWEYGKGTIITKEPVAFIMPFHMQGCGFNEVTPD